MKAIFSCHRENMAWITDYFPDMNPYLLPVVNKPLIEYWIDFCRICGITDILVLDPEYDINLASILEKNGESLNIIYIGENVTDNPERIFERHSSFLGDKRELLIFNGLFFLHYDMSAKPENPLTLDTPWPKCRKGNGIFTYGNAGLERTENRITDISGIRRYFDLNMYVLSSEQSCYALPGYNIQNDVFTGMNVVLPPDVIIEPPAMLRNNVVMESLSGAGPEGIIGNNVIVDTGSIVQRSIVLDNTYIGRDLELQNKIVFRNCVIDPASDTMVNLVDARITGEFSLNSRKPFIPRVVLGYIVTIMLVIILTIPYLFIRILGVKRMKKRAFLRFRQGKFSEKILYNCYFYKKPTRRAKYFHRLSLDKYELLLLVLRGKLSLVGNYLYDATEDDIEDFIRKNYFDYKGGVFSFPELSNMNRQRFELLMDDLYYEHNKTPFMKLKILVRCIIFRLFGRYEDT